LKIYCGVRRAREAQAIGVLGGPRVHQRGGRAIRHKVE